MRANIEGSLQKKSKENDVIKLLQSPENTLPILAKINNRITIRKFKTSQKFNGTDDIPKVTKKKKTKIDDKVVKKEWKKMVKQYNKDVDDVNKQSEQLHFQKEKEQERNKKLKLMLELLKQKASNEKLIIQKSNGHSSKEVKDAKNSQKQRDLKKQPAKHINDSLTEHLVNSNENVAFKLKKKQQLYNKLKETLKETREETKVKKPVLSLRQKMMEKLKAARFRFLNEQIYTANSKEAQKIFQSDPEAFKAYHEGYRQQVKNWPLNPLDYIIRSIKKM